jgi:sugar O-acyltransferase (sialic acid O-acetyltransferase NeuD family)
MVMAKKVVIFGTEKMAQLAHFYLTKDSPYEVAAFTVDEKYITGKCFINLPVVSFETVERAYPPDEYSMFVAVGYKRLNTLRAAKYAEAKEKGYKFISYVSSKATHWGDTEIGENSLILENQVIQPFVKVGNDVVIWSGNHFGHDVVIGDHCFIASHAVICGGVKIEPYCFIGVNATIRDDVTIGRECIIGAGALILKETKDREVYIAKQTELFRLDSAHFERMMEISR